MVKSSLFLQFQASAQIATATNYLIFLTDKGTIEYEEIGSAEYIDPGSTPKSIIGLFYQPENKDVKYIIVGVIINGKPLSVQYLPTLRFLTPFEISCIKDFTFTQFVQSSNFRSFNEINLNANGVNPTLANEKNVFATARFSNMVASIDTPTIFGFLQ